VDRGIFFTSRQDSNVYNPSQFYTINFPILESLSRHTITYPWLLYYIEHFSSTSLHKHWHIYMLSPRYFHIPWYKCCYNIYTIPLPYTRFSISYIRCYNIFCLHAVFWMLLTILHHWVVLKKNVLNSWCIGHFSWVGWMLDYVCLLWSYCKNFVVSTKNPSNFHYNWSINAWVWARLEQWESDIC